MSKFNLLGKKKADMTEFADLEHIGLALERVTSADKNDYFDQYGRRRQRDLKPLDKERLFFYETQILSAVNRTAKKMFKNWFDMDNPKTDKTINEKQKNDLEAFHKDIQLKAKKIQQCIDALVHGNGYCELIPMSPNINPEQPIRPEMGLYDVVTVDPMYMLPKVEYIPNTGGKQWYYMELQKDYSIKKIHNSRIDHVKWFTIGTMPFGYGVIEVALRSVLQKIKMDWAVGEIVYRYGKPFLVLKVKGATKKEMEYAVKLLQKLNPHTGFAGTDRHEFEILNPETIKPKEFADFYYQNLAAALEMPRFEFLGAQRGQVTGGEVDLAGWHDILLSNFEAKFSPTFNTINNFYLKGKWDGEIYPNPIFVDEKSQSEIEERIAKTVELLHTKSGVMMDSEARQYLRNKGFDCILEENDEEFEPDEEEMPEETPEMPVNPFDDIPLQRVPYGLSPMDKQRIEREKQLAKEAMDEGRAG